MSDFNLRIIFILFTMALYQMAMAVKSPSYLCHGCIPLPPWFLGNYSVQIITHFRSITPSGQSWCSTQLLTLKMMMQLYEEGGVCDKRFTCTSLRKAKGGPASYNVIEILYNSIIYLAGTCMFAFFVTLYRNEKALGVMESHKIERLAVRDHSASQWEETVERSRTLWK